MAGTVSGQHGDRRAYQRGCRCVACSAANAEYAAGLRDRHAAKRRVVDGVFVALGRDHGKASTYTEYGCRCPDCSAAYSADQKTYQDRYRTNRNRR
jgi:hypothetical protein